MVYQSPISSIPSQLSASSDMPVLRQKTRCLQPRANPIMTASSVPTYCMFAWKGVTLPCLLNFVQACDSPNKCPVVVNSIRASVSGSYGHVTTSSCYTISRRGYEGQVITNQKPSRNPTQRRESRSTLPPYDFARLLIWRTTIMASCSKSPTVMLSECYTGFCATS